MHKFLVAIDASALSHLSISGLDSNGVYVSAQCEGQRVEKAVVGLRDPFSDRVMRQMAVIANRDRVMATVLPGIQMVLHDMAIDARLWVVT